MANPELGDRVEAIRQLLDAFRFERFVYLSVTLVSLAILIGCAVQLARQPEPDVSLLLMVVGGSGGIVYTTGRLLKMWSDAVRILAPTVGERGADGGA